MATMRYIVDVKNSGRTFAGKEVFLHGTPRPEAAAELRQLLAGLPANQMLSAVALMGLAIEQEDGRVGGHPILPHALPYLAQMSIMLSDDDRQAPVDDRALGEAMRLFADLEEEPLPGDSQSVHEARLERAVRLSEQQLALQAEIHHLASRADVLFGRVWPTVERAGAIVPETELQAMTGMGLRELLAMGMWFAAAARQNAGIIDPERAQAAGARDLRPETFTPEKVQRFVDWLARDYASFRIEAERTPPPRPALDKYRPNPLRTFPLVRPTNVPPRLGPRTVIAPSWQLILERVTNGVFFDFAERHRGGRSENPFREAFGHVFQEYVGVLLREALGADRVLAEWTYRHDGQEVATPDWIVVEGERAVVVEVKHSTLFRTARTWGDPTAIRKDLSQSLLTAARQVGRFVERARAHAVGLEQLRGVRHFTTLIVCYDRLHFANSFMRNELMAALSAGGTSRVDLQIAPIEGFEYLLGLCEGGSLFDALAGKSADPNTDFMDFRDWLVATVGRRTPNRFLDDHHNRFCEWAGFPHNGST